MLNNDTPFSFPCEFSVKTFGKNTPEYQQAVLTIMRQHVPDLTESCLKERASRDENYLALTITFTAKDKAQLDAIYQALTDCDLVTLAL